MSAEDPRFAGIARLYGIEGLARLRAAHVAVVGIGGEISPTPLRAMASAAHEPTPPIPTTAT